jgi:hypothetical protein
MVSSGGKSTSHRATPLELQSINASNYIHVSATEVAKAAWHKSSRSSFNGSCVEVAELQRNRVCVRDTKAAGAGPVLVFTHTEWKSLLKRIKAGDLHFGR